MEMREKRGYAIVVGGGKQIEVELKRLSDVLEESGVPQEVGTRVDLLQVKVLRGINDADSKKVDNFVMEKANCSDVKGAIDELSLSRGKGCCG